MVIDIPPPVKQEKEIVVMWTKKEVNFFHHWWGEGEEKQIQVDYIGKAYVVEDQDAIYYFILPSQKGD